MVSALKPLIGYKLGGLVVGVIVKVIVWKLGMSAALSKYIVNASAEKVA